MKKIILKASVLFIFVFFNIKPSNAQTVNAKYLIPTYEVGSKYKFTIFGSWIGGFMQHINADPSYGNGDDFCIYTYGNRDITIKTGNGDNAVSNGNFIIFPTIGTAKVGIGKSNPSYTLDVNGDINFSGNLYKNGQTFISYTDGNVGIGTTTPNKTLEVYGEGIEGIGSDVPNIRLTTDITNPEVGTCYNAWDIRSYDFSLDFAYGFSTETSNPTTDDVISFSRYGAIFASRFAEKSDTRYFLDPAATGTSLKVAGKIEANRYGPIYINTDYDNPIKFNNTDGGYHYISWWVPGTRRAWLGLSSDGTTFSVASENELTLHSGSGKYIKAYTDEFWVRNDFKVTGTGVVYAREVNVMNGAFPDYVFKPEYKLRNLTEVEEYIKENQHLPGVPSEKEVSENGLNIAEMNNIMMEKIEELTLYVIKLKKENEDIKRELKELKNSK